MSKEIRVSIVVPTHNHLDDCLRPCIEAVLEFTDMSDKEIIVVANGCRDGTRDYLTSLEACGLPVRTVWYDEGVGYTKATNAGIIVSRGKFVILLNNDAFLMEQPRDYWVNVLLEPMLRNERVGVTGPMMGWSDPAEAHFLIFFCVAVRMSTLVDVGLLDEDYTPGGGEDTAFCIEAARNGWEVLQVPTSHIVWEAEFATGNFPIYHKGEATMHDAEHIGEWPGIFKRNSDKLRERYATGIPMGILCNNFERAPVGVTDTPPPREYARYRWAASMTPMGESVLDLGCATGYGSRFFPGRPYAGVDCSETSIEYCKKTYPKRTFYCADFERQPAESYAERSDVIVAFEVIEHLANGRELAQELKNHCDLLMLTVPYMEPPGLHGPHHKLHGLSEVDFPGFDYSYMDEQGRISYTPQPGINLMLMSWRRAKDLDVNL